MKSFENHHSVALSRPSFPGVASAADVSCGWSPFQKGDLYITFDVRFPDKAFSKEDEESMSRSG
jgi:hypothetical protein